MADTGLFLDVVSYNVLCSHLSKAEELPRCDKDACDPHKRLVRVGKKLLDHVLDNRIICLQELSREWYELLLSTFTAYGYVIVPGLYGNKHNNYMGVAVAYPLKLYHLVGVSTPRVADGAQWPFQPRPHESAAKQAWTSLSSWTTWYTGSVDPNAPKKPTENAVERARSRYNQLVMLRLKDLVSGEEFVVGTYHMPCAFDWPDQMRLHAAAVASQSLAFARGGPLVLAGDFNFKPDSDCYRIVTEGRMTAEEEVDTLSRYPDLDAAKHLRSPMPLKSAYVTAKGAEPKFTIHSYAEWNGPNEFTGTLDYIFHSDHFVSVSAARLPRSEDVFATPLPTIEEPSDHLLIRAILRTE